MIKVDVKSNQDQALEFVESLKKHPLLKGLDININNANDYALFVSEHDNCIKCNGLKSCLNSTVGFTSIVEDGVIVARPCKFKKEEVLKSKENSLIKTLFVSKSILNADLKDFDTNTENRIKIYKYINNFISKTKQNEFEKGLYIYGDFSTGKTYILGCIANELARNNVECLIIYFPDLVVELKNAMNTPRFEELINHLKSVDVLMLDDLGSENMTPWLRDEILGPILNYRLMEEKTLFISSNINVESYKDFLNIEKQNNNLKAERIKSRLLGSIKEIELDNVKYKR